MKNIIPFKKDVTFKTNLSEITSISLENNLSLKNNKVNGEFIVSGEYKVSDKSISVEPFEIKLPFEIDIDDRFDTSKSIVDIDDFYYEIINNDTLSISIDVLIDHLKEKMDDLIEIKEDVTTLESEENDMESEVTLTNDINNRCIEEEIPEVDAKTGEEKAIDLVDDKIKSIFNSTNKDSEAYVTYNVFIVREGDTLDGILEKYNTTLEELKKYNDLTNLQLGDKIIIPNTYERN